MSRENHLIARSPARRRCVLLCSAALAALVVLSGAAGAFAAVTVANVYSSQRAGTKLVDICYDVTADAPPVSVTVQVSSDGGATYGVAASSFTGDVGTGLQPGTGKHIVWNAGANWNGNVSANMQFKVVATDSGTPPVPSGFVLIPAGSFSMGDALDGESDAPVHTVSVSAFYMEATVVTKAQWDGVYTWAVAHGYGFSTSGCGKASNHPVVWVNWYDAVKWCNARSEQEGSTPCYTVSGSVYRSGQSDAAVCNMSASGYRLPTEAEWEKAARGGLSGHRFPWGDTIDRSRANYDVYKSGTSTTNYFPYDFGTPGGCDPKYDGAAEPYTSPVGSFVANGYGLYDMAGNVSEWCWDWYGTYGSGALSDPTGPVSAGYRRVSRGGGWIDIANWVRVSARGYSAPGGDVSRLSTGFRCVHR